MTQVVRISGKDEKRQRAKAAKEKLEVKLVTDIDKKRAAAKWREGVA